MGQEDSKTKINNLKLKFLAAISMEFGGHSVAEIFFEESDEQSVNTGQGASVFAEGELFFTESKKNFFKSHSWF